MPTSTQTRQPRSSILPRHSMPTMRRMIPSRITGSGTYSAENTVAYQLGEGGEHRGAGGDQPDLISVPDRADGVQHGAATPLGIALAHHAQRRHQHADPEVEPLQNQEAEK
jgi:hypothetical protein